VSGLGSAGLSAKTWRSGGRHRGGYSDLFSGFPGKWLEYGRGKGETENTRFRFKQAANLDPQAPLSALEDLYVGSFILLMDRDQTCGPANGPAPQPKRQELRHFFHISASPARIWVVSYSELLKLAVNDVSFALLHSYRLKHKDLR
jgi:hypothetical protein